MSSKEVSIEEEIATTRKEHPHVVILGSGASRAACLEGDKNGRQLPLISDFCSTLNIESLLLSWGINPKQNIEEICSTLLQNGELAKIEKLQTIIGAYFNEIELPDFPTVYDYLILSLREKDIIATFNWDPLLMQAYQRNQESGLALPQLAFLHGNVSLGYCTTDQKSGLIGQTCDVCKRPFKRMPLLHPIQPHNYPQIKFIKNQWIRLEQVMEDSFMISIFGYSGPKTDVEATRIFKKIFANVESTKERLISFITDQDVYVVSKTWMTYLENRLYDVYDSFFDSWIANHPRRTGEAFINLFIDSKFIDLNPMPRNISLPDLWEWYAKFKSAENLR